MAGRATPARAKPTLPSTGSEGAVHQDWLVGEGDVEGLVDLGADVGGEGEDFLGSGGASVGEREGVSGGDGGSADREALRDAGVLDQPGSAGFHPAVGHRPLRRASWYVGCRVEDRVGEEGAGAPGVVVGLVEDHAFAAPQRQDSLAYVGHRGARARVDVQHPGQFGVPDRRREVAELQLEGDIEYDVPRGVGLEARVPVAESAVGREDRADRVVDPVPDAHGSDRLGHLVSVGADVLDRRGSGQPGDAGHGLESAPLLGDRALDHRVPVLSGRDVDHRAGTHVRFDLDPAGGDLDHGPAEPVVADEHVAAAGQQEYRFLGGVGVADGGDQVILGGDFDELVGQSTDAQGGEVGQAHMGSHWTRTTALARPSTFSSPAIAVMSISARPSATLSTLAENVTLAPLSSSGTTTGLVNRTPYSTRSAGSSSQSVTTRTADAMVSMPCAITPGRPSAAAIRSLQWIGLKSPLAPAYRTRSSRRNVTVSDGSSVPTSTVLIHVLASLRARM